MMVAACAKQKTTWYSRNVPDPRTAVATDLRVTWRRRRAQPDGSRDSEVAVDLVVKDSYGRICAVDDGRSKSDRRDDAAAAVALDSRS